MKRYSYCLISLVVILLLGVMVTQAGTISYVRGVVSNQAGQPVSGAQIVISAGDWNIPMTSGADGSFETAGIGVSDVYLIVSITITAEGYGTYIQKDTVLYGGDTLILDHIVLRAENQVIDDGGLPTSRELPPISALQNFTQAQGNFASHPLFFSNDTIPSTIRVAITDYANCGYWSNGSYILYPIIRVDTLPFRDYVKGVLPHEWISSWNGASLRAGAMAVKMYGWFKINIGPRGIWNGQPYDVRADTCDQVYTGATYASTNAAVDETWDYMMRQNGQVVEIHYVDGIQATCVGTFPGKPCMEQWGSKSLGDQGWSWQSILQYYYNTLQLSGGITGNYTTPDDGATVGNSGYLAGTASAYAGVREVHFTANWGGIWRLLGIDSSAPYEYHWDLCAWGVPNGSVQLGFDVTDNNGTQVLSPEGTRAITVSADCSQPRGGLTAPLDGKQVGKSVSLGAWAAANSGVQEVRFTAIWTGKSEFIVATDSVAPYGYTWDLCGNDVLDGDITIGIEIMDKNGQVAISPTGARTVTKASTCAHNAAPARNVFTTEPPTVTWNRVIWATRYELQVAGNTVFNSLSYSDNAISSDTLAMTLPTFPNGTYYWRVRACSSTCGSWSTVRFTVMLPAALKSVITL